MKMKITLKPEALARIRKENELIKKLKLVKVYHDVSVFDEYNLSRDEIKRIAKIYEDKRKGMTNYEKRKYHDENNITFRINGVKEEDKKNYIDDYVKRLKKYRGKIDAEEKEKQKYNNDIIIASENSKDVYKLTKENIQKNNKTIELKREYVNKIISYISNEKKSKYKIVNNVMIYDINNVTFSYAVGTGSGDEGVYWDYNLSDKQQALLVERTNNVILDVEDKTVESFYISATKETKRYLNPFGQEDYVIVYIEGTNTEKVYAYAIVLGNTIRTVEVVGDQEGFYDKINNTNNVVEKVTVSTINNEINEYIKKIDSSYEYDTYSCVWTSVRLLSNEFTHKGFKYCDSETMKTYDDYKVKRSAPVKLDSRFNVVEYPLTEKDNCFMDMCNYIFNGKKEKKEKIWTKLSNAYKSLRYVFETYKKHFNTWNIEGKIIESSRNNMADTNILLHANHVYLLNGKPQVVENNSKNIKYEPELMNKFEEFIKQGIEPSDIKIAGVCKKRDLNMLNTLAQPVLSSFNFDGITYTNNLEYFECSKILNKFGITPTLDCNKGNVVKHIMDFFIGNDIKNLKSVFPNSNNFTRGAVLYVDRDRVKDIKETRDCNGSYITALRDLKKVYKIDMSKNETYQYEDEPIMDNCIYNIEVLKSTFHFQTSGIYHGQYINECKDRNIDLSNIKIKEYIVGVECENVYKKVIDEIEDKMNPNNCKCENKCKLDTDECIANYKIIKNSYKVYLGCLAVNKKRQKCSYKYNSIIDKEEAEALIKSDIIMHNITDSDMYLAYTEQINDKSDENFKLIWLQMMDKSRLNMYDYMIENDITDSNIVQIKTDSISINKKFKLEVDNKYKLGGYKNETFKELKFDTVPYNDFITLNISESYNLNELNLLPAGCGKTTAIKKLISSFNMKEEKVCVLCPSNKALRIYKKLSKQMTNVDAQIICDFTEYEDLKKYSRIIIDEVGMVSDFSWIIIRKLIVNGYIVYAFGDFKQLPSIDKMNTLNKNRNVYIPKLFGDFSEQYMNMLFSTIKTSDENTINYRNDFNLSYYEDIISDKLCALEEVLKHETSFEEAEYIVAYSRKTRDLNNLKKMQLLGYKNLEYKYTEGKYSNKNKIIGFVQKGVRIICDLTDRPQSSNKLKNRGICNGAEYIIKEINGSIVVLEEKQINGIESDTIEIPLEEIERHFIPSYAITLYKLQGDTIESYHWCKEDNSQLDSKIRNMYAYVLISRLEKKRNNCINAVKLD